MAKTKNQMKIVRPLNTRGVLDKGYAVSMIKTMFKLVPVNTRATEMKKERRNVREPITY